MNVFMNVFSLLMILIIFTYFIIYRKRLIKLNLMYSILNIVIILGIIVDIIYLLVNGPKMENEALSFALTKLYLVLLSLDSFCFFLYSINEMYEKDDKEFKVVRITSLVIFIICLIFVIALPKSYAYDKNNQLYLTGPSLTASYITSFIYVTLAFILAIVNRKKLFKRKMLAITIYFALWMFQVGSQIVFDFIMDKDEIMYFGRLASAIGSLSIFALIENPENDTESDLGFYNDTAFRKHTERSFKNDSPKTNLIILSFDKEYYKDYNVLISALRNIRKAIRNDISISFKYDPYTFIFENRHNNIVSLKKDIEEAELKDQELFSQSHTHITLLPDNLEFKDSEEFLKIINEISKHVNFEKNIYLIKKEDIDNIKEDILMSNTITKALKDNKVVVYYQGIVDNKSGKIEACEALVRLLDENGSIIPPTKFIPLIEKDSRIISLSETVFEHVCKFIKTNDLKKLGINYVEVNLSVNQFLDPFLVEKYVSIAKVYNVDPKKINFEITETGNININLVIDQMKKFIDAGFNFSLDDFGTGNSNLNYIINMPVDIVKFDMSVVKSYFKSNIAKIVIDNSITMIKELGKKIVFEGVEEEKEIQYIKNLDVDFIQGYYYYKPMSEKDFVKKLTNK